MALSRLFNSFRVRLLLLLAALFVLTLGVQYYVNRSSVRTNTRLIVQQQQAIMAGVALGVNSISSGLYLDQMRDQAKQPLLGEQAERVKNVLIVDDDDNLKTSGASVLAIHPCSFTRDYLFDGDRRLALYSSNQVAVICRTARGRWRLFFQSSDQ